MSTLRPAPILRPSPKPDFTPESILDPKPETEPDAPDVGPDVVDAPTRPPDRKPLLTAAMIAAVVLLTAAAASIVVGGSTDDLATAPGNEPAAPEADDDSEQPSAASESQGELNSTVDDFRLAMKEHGLSADALADRQITGFASTYCAHAAGAEDRAAFDELRQRVIAAAGSERHPDPTRSHHHDRRGSVLPGRVRSARSQRGSVRAVSRESPIHSGTNCATAKARPATRISQRSAV